MLRRVIGDHHVEDHVVAAKPMLPATINRRLRLQAERPRRLPTRVQGICRHDDVGHDIDVSGDAPRGHAGQMAVQRNHLATDEQPVVRLQLVRQARDLCP